MDSYQDNFADNEKEYLPFSSPTLRRVLVTGGTGFIGAYIIKRLVEKGIQVSAIRRSLKTPFFIPKEIFDTVRWIEGDVLDVVSLDDAMEDVDGVVHAAAVVSFNREDRARMYAVNVEGTANVVNAAVDHQVARFVHISSVAALGRRENNELVTEGRQWEEHKNNTHYAISKHKAELEIWRGFAEGLEGVIINPSTVLGYSDWHQSSGAIFKNGYKEFPWYTKGINGFVGVEDVAEAAVELLASGIHGRRYIVNAENISFQQLFNTIAEGFQKRKPTLEASAYLGQIVWRIEAVKAFFTGKKPLLTRETAKVASSMTQFDNGALLQALPRFSYSPLETVIKGACKNFEQALEKGLLTL
jgi:nucleoside-diphosphate-sugar epimerase